MYGFLCDMDGVIYRGRQVVPGAVRFVQTLQRTNRPYLFLTNNPDRTPLQLSRALKHLGMEVPPTHFHTSAQATASFLNSQSKRPRVFVIGEKSLRQELEAIGATLTDRDPEYVVVGSPKNYDYQQVKKAINLVAKGSRLLGTNPDPMGPTEAGMKPGCGALIAPIERATGRTAYFIGKPNPLMMRIAVRSMGVRSSEAYMVGDRMDTDIVGGIEAGMKTILVLSGVTQRSDLVRYPYRPDHIYEHVGKIPLEKLQ
jgi:NagD protein